MKSLTIAFISLASTVTAATQQKCGINYTPCAAKGATSDSVPAVGSELKDLYEQIVESVHEQSDKLPENLGKDGTTSLCCPSNLKCMLLGHYDVSFCWDQFTTNYFFEDGSYGSVTDGDYHANSGDKANLISGDYTLKNGQTGNIYTSDEGSKPNTATMDLPPQWTGTGVGSAIPASELGQIPTTTHPAPVAATIIPASVVPETTVSGSVIPGTTIPATTIDGATATVTVTSSPSASQSDKNGCGRIDPRGTILISILCSLMAYGFCGILS